MIVIKVHHFLRGLFEPLAEPLPLSLPTLLVIAFEPLLFSLLFAPVELFEPPAGPLSEPLPRACFFIGLSFPLSLPLRWTVVVVVVVAFGFGCVPPVLIILSVSTR